MVFYFILCDIRNISFNIKENVIALKMLRWMCIEISKYKWKFPFEWSFKNPASNQPVVLIHQILMRFAWTQSGVGSNKRSCRVPVIIKLTAWREAERLRYTPWGEMHVNNLQSVGALGAFSRVLETSENLEWTSLDWSGRLSGGV